MDKQTKTVYDKLVGMKEECSKMNLVYIMEAISESKGKEEQEFFVLIENYLLQTRQREVIQKGIF